MEIDVDAVSLVATQFDGSSEGVDLIAASVATLGFGPSGAGRNYADVGGRISAAYDGIENACRRWREATKENAVALRASVHGYLSEDERFAGSLGRPEGER